MPDPTPYEVLKSLADAQAQVIKTAGLTLEEVKQAFTDAWHRVSVATPDPTPSRSLSLAQRDLFGRILARWRTDSAYVDELGEPRPLPVTSDDGPSFSSLFDDALGASSADIDAATTMEIFRDALTVEVLDDGRVRPLTVAFFVNAIGVSGAIANLAYIAEYSVTVATNMADPTEKNRFQCVARSSGFPMGKLTDLVAMLEDQGLDFLQQVDEFIEQESAHCPDDAQPQEVAVGLFLFNKPTPDTDNSE